MAWAWAWTWIGVHFFLIFRFTIIGFLQQRVFFFGYCFLMIIRYSVFPRVSFYIHTHIHNTYMTRRLGQKKEEEEEEEEEEEGRLLFCVIRFLLLLR
ncbi:hypothetical protein F4779DRAFT_364189 [Xylariaceae sp. FL0662B]|nr:hypothetical protein F4779DRAFT_364189 [Xylariaceae sp. FL0662B]